mmetsp:Transcript_50490/g.146517  ORF Transcript_50490/g.146517 Transcript_50490/m.146517 type:complete len:320 (-) Transcript_50490:762-1721(-)
MSQRSHRSVSALCDALTMFPWLTLQRQCDPSPSTINHSDACESKLKAPPQRQCPMYTGSANCIRRPSRHCQADTSPRFLLTQVPVRGSTPTASINPYRSYAGFAAGRSRPLSSCQRRRCPSQPPDAHMPVLGSKTTAATTWQPCARSTGSAAGLRLGASPPPAKRQRQIDPRWPPVIHVPAWGSKPRERIGSPSSSSWVNCTTGMRRSFFTCQRQRDLADWQQLAHMPVLGSKLNESIPCASSAGFATCTRLSPLQRHTRMGGPLASIPVSGSRARASKYDPLLDSSCTPVTCTRWQPSSRQRRMKLSWPALIQRLNSS